MLFSSVYDAGIGASPRLADPVCVFSMMALEEVSG
jgi:hypothetical protein